MSQDHFKSEPLRQADHEPARDPRDCIVTESGLVPILITDWNVEVLRKISLEVEAAGFGVVYTREPSLFLRLIEERDFQCGVIGDSIPSHVRIELARASKQLRPDLPLVIIKKAPADDDLLRPHAARFVPSGDPVQLLNAVRSVTRKSPAKCQSR